MPPLPKFDLPAFQQDIQDNSANSKKLAERWSDNLNRFSEQTLQNDPWSSVNQPRLTEYYNPLSTDLPAGAQGAAISWTAFPRRIQTTFPNVGQRKQWQYADEGPPDPNYSPTGPRGWQDEYCEWSVTRNSAGKITKVSFTCENREYWYTLWDVDPNTVLRVYQQLAGNHIQLEDLYLRDDNGNPIIDRQTGRSAYNDRNPWNSSTTNGAVHLVSNPNSLSAEIFLAGQATILREDSQGNPITDPNQLINCSRYGTPNRNSDPHIGASVNALVRGTGTVGSGVRVSLENPVGLYIQTPSFQSYQLPFTAPAGAKPADYWKVVRGRTRQAGEPIDYILHAVYEVPPDQGFTVSDITIDGFSIDFGSQITQTFQIALAGFPVPQTPPPPTSLRCAGSSSNPLPRPYVLYDVNTLPVALRSSSTMRIEPGTSVENVGLYAFDSSRFATIAIQGGAGVTVEKTGFQPVQGAQLFLLRVSVASDAPAGNRTLLLTNPDGSHGPAAYGLLEVVPPGTLGATPAPVPTVRALAAEAPVLVPNLAALGEFAKSAGRSR